MARSLIITRNGAIAGCRLVDSGRRGYRCSGVPTGGAADAEAAAAGNRLLGLPAEHPCIEIPLRGGSWRLEGSGQLVLTGADFGWTLGGVPVATYTVLSWDGVGELRGGTSRAGCRGYLAVAGEWCVPRILGSIEPGLDPRCDLKPGIAVQIITDKHQVLPQPPYAPPGYPRPGEIVELPVVAGPEWRQLGSYDRQELLRRIHYVDPRSSRQGVRLVTKEALVVSVPPLLSSPVLPGTVQWTPAGAIVLGPDAQTIGGYPRILYTSQWGRVMQCPPGVGLRFVLTR